MFIPSVSQGKVRGVVCHGLGWVGIRGGSTVWTGAAPLPPCIHTEITQRETIEAHFAQVASIWGEPEAVELGRGVRKTRFNQGFSAPLFQYLAVRM